MGEDKKSSYCSLQTDKLLAPPWGHGPLSILTGSAQARQEVSSSLRVGRKRQRPRSPSEEATRKERDFCEEKSTCLEALEERLGRGLQEGKRRVSSAGHDVGCLAFPGVEIEELRRRQWPKSVFQSPGWNENSSHWLHLLNLQGPEGLMTQGGYDMVQKLFLDFFRRRLSQRPTAEELEQRNILKRK